MKKWASKNIILCPACNNTYEYCHGEFVSPYFRHKDKCKCEALYSEPETEEHIKGKQALYEWVKKMDGVLDAVLEGWLPETKQRPDIMFKFKGKQYVIEYQCTPIATEYVERHELYQAAGIVDIWILGTKNYHIKEDGDSVFHDGDLGSYKRYKTIEKYNNFYFNADNLNVYISKEVFKDQLNLKFARISKKFHALKTESLKLSHEKGMFILNQSALNDFSDIQEEDRRLSEEHDEKCFAITLAESTLDKIINELKLKFPHAENIISGEVKFSRYYIYCISVGSYKFFIKENKVDFCMLQEKSVVIGRGKRGGPRWGKRMMYETLSTMNCLYTDNLKITKFICMHVWRCI